MQTFRTKKAAKAYATDMSWTEADADRVFKGLPLPIDEMALLNMMVRFAGPELYERQKKQGAQAGIATKKANELERLSAQFLDVVTDYESQIESDRSAFVPIVKKLYSVAQRFGYHNPWIETLLVTYDRYITTHPAKKAS